MATAAKKPAAPLKSAPPAKKSSIPAPPKRKAPEPPPPPEPEEEAPIEAEEEIIATASTETEDDDGGYPTQEYMPEVTLEPEAHQSIITSVESYIPETEGNSPQIRIHMTHNDDETGRDRKYGFFVPAPFAEYFDEISTAMLNGQNVGSLTVDGEETGAPILSQESRVSKNGFPLPSDFEEFSKNITNKAHSSKLDKIRKIAREQDRTFKSVGIDLHDVHTFQEFGDIALNALLSGLSVVSLWSAKPGQQFLNCDSLLGPEAWDDPSTKTGIPSRYRKGKKE